MTSTQIITPRFGAIEFLNEDVVSFPEGILGFADKREFLLLQHRDGSPFRWLQSLDDPSLAFLVVPPEEFIENYAPVISDEDAASVGLSEDTPRLVYTIVTIPQGKPEEMTINLAGPIVINAISRVARQLVLQSEGYAVKQRILDAKPVCGQAVA